MSDEQLSDEERFSQLVKRRDEIHDIWRVDARNWPPEPDEHFLIRYSEALCVRIAELEACMKRAGLIAFMRGTPEEVANHLHEVAESNVDYIAELEKKLKEQEEMLDALKRGKVF